MSYFTILNLDREPFSNSPEPEFFFEAPQHVNCLQQLEISIRLRRGLNIVIGDVGTGKTTLSRMLIRRLHGDKTVEFHLLMDPDFSGPVPFLTGIARMMGIADSDSSFTEWQIKESIKKVLFRRGIEENKIIVLIIDEGQKLPEFSIEILRELLNYETNQFKLLQIVIFAQPEFSAILKRRENFADRVNIRLRLGPLGFGLMRQMIEHRIELASRIGREPVSFTLPALAAIYLATGGVPRKVIMLCHRVILAMIIRNRTRAGWFLVQSCIGTRLSRRNRRRNLGWGAAVVLGTAAWVIMAGSGGKHSPAVVVGERLTSAYQARIADKTVYPLVPSRAETWQMPLPLVRKSISKMPAGEEPSAPSGQK